MKSLPLIILVASVYGCSYEKSETTTGGGQGSTVTSIDCSVVQGGNDDAVNTLGDTCPDNTDNSGIPVEPLAFNPIEISTAPPPAIENCSAASQQNGDCVPVTGAE